MEAEHDLTPNLNYIDALAERIYWLVNPFDTYVKDRLEYRCYAALALSKGRGATLEDVHNAWAVWKAGERPDHKSLRPFKDLDEFTQQRSVPYLEAIHQVSEVHSLSFSSAEFDVLRIAGSILDNEEYILKTIEQWDALYSAREKIKEAIEQLNGR